LAAALLTALVAEQASRPAGKQQPCCTSKSPRRRPGALQGTESRRSIPGTSPPSTMDRLRPHGIAPAIAASCHFPQQRHRLPASFDIWELVGRWRCFLNFGDRKPLSGRAVGITVTESGRTVSDPLGFTTPVRYRVGRLRPGEIAVCSPSTAPRSPNDPHAAEGGRN
jgi:hypothetical protein